MPKNLVIVESPTKAKTIGRFLGSKYAVMSSVGHVRDLPKGSLGVDIENDFAPKYVVPKDKTKTVKELKQAASKASTIYLATDPDREGEAIAWHLFEGLKLKEKTVQRVVFHEITEQAVKEAFSNPRGIDSSLVEAQQARRVLDRLVGFQLSPLLWKKIRYGLSAGRVQSAALLMLVTREREIEAFDPVEYWHLVADLTKPEPDDKATTTFSALLSRLKGAKSKLAITNQNEANAIVAELQNATYTVKEVTKKETKSRPAAPFTTSTLQQEAARKLRYATRRTMQLAQQLYEGISVNGSEAEGLITYMRTDSPTVSPSAIQEARDFVKSKHGESYLPAKPRGYSARSKNAQEAHEAIRPTSVKRTPESMKGALDAQQLRLYELIWRRMVASQMADAIFDSVSIQVEAVPPTKSTSYIFQANGSTLKFAGFKALYTEGTDEEEDEEKALPQLSQGTSLNCLRLDPQQKFTQPPPRYSDASLVKALEENGIGRPSTYATTVSNLQDREYVKKEAARLQPTKLGALVNDLLQVSVPDIIHLNFTARMEEVLDDIAGGGKSWVPYIREFYDPFVQAIETSIATAPKTPETTGETCEACGNTMEIKSGRFGLFQSCSNYPECKTTKPLQIKLGVKCPEDGDELLQKKSRKGKTFYACANYPDCTFSTALRPIPEPCPECKGLLTEFRRGTAKCNSCDYTGRRPKPEENAEQDGGQEAA
ncbi:type I DNA topoisomerase [Dehalococcoidia bacterium]|nr:type I DNA topoisomerase [Dehalococcoidia bacterium]